MWNLKSDQWIFLTLITLNPIHLFCTLNGFFYPYIILLNYTLVTWKMFVLWIKHLFWMMIYYLLSKITFVTITTNSIIRKVFKPIAGDKALIFTWKFKCYHWQQKNQLISWSYRSSLFIFAMLTANYVKFCQSFFSQVKLVFPEQKQLVQRATQTITHIGFARHNHCP